MYFPDPPLAAFVEVLWFVAGRAHFARDRRLPTGKAHLLFNLGAAPTLFSPRERRRRPPLSHLLVSGQQNSYIETGSHGDTVLLGAQFHSHGAYRLLHIGQHELSNQVIELESLLGDRVLALRQRLLDSPSPQACFALLEQWLVDRLDRGARVHPAVLATSLAVSKNPGRLQMGELSRSMGLSQEHLIRRFREQVGLTPKAYANILRFERALGLARAKTASWSQIALSCGYYDQAHLVRDFQRFAGRAPASLLRDRMPDGDSIVVD